MIFSTANLCLFVGVLTGRRGILPWSLRATAFTLPVALLLLLFAPEIDLGPGFWFGGFIGLPTVAFALTVRPRTAVIYFLSTVGTLALINMYIQGRHAADELLANVGFAIINTFAFVIIASYARQISRMTDETEDRARRDTVRATRLRVREQEMVGFTALVHDYVLSGLSGIASGIHPVNPLREDRFSSVGGYTEVDAGEFAEAIRDVIREHSPGCVLSISISDDAVSVARPAATSIVLALAETVKNSTRHAGAEANRRCTLSATQRGIDVEFSDDGPGFDPAEIRPTAAGLKISVQGRMASVLGGAALVESSPRHDTAVKLSWRAEESTVEPEPIGGNGVYQSLGMDIVFSPQFGLAVALVSAALLAANGYPLTPTGVACLSIIAGILFLLIPGTWNTLPLTRATVITGGLALLALRGRPRFAVISVFSSAALVEVVHRTGASPDTWNTGFTVLSSSIIVAAATLVHFGVRFFFRRLPKAREDMRRAHREAAALEEATAQRHRNLQELQDTVEPVFESADCLDPVPEALRLRAKLTEQRLRDT